MKISIVTISYNQAPYLRRCIESIINQEYVNVEYIVVDPGSSDESRVIIDSYGDKIIKVYDPDCGPSDGLNNGFAKATGDIFGFINSDDYLLPGALKHVENFFLMSKPNTFVSGCGFIDNLGKDKKPIKPSVMTKLTLLYQVCTIFQQGTFFPSYMFKKVNGFNSSNKTCWDYEFFLSLILNGFKNKILNMDIATFTIHPASITGSGEQNMAYKNSMNEIFFKVYGRGFNSFDWIIRLCFRIAKRLGIWLDRLKLIFLKNYGENF